MNDIFSKKNDLLIVNEDESGMRLDVFLKQRLPDFSRTYFQELIEKNLVLVNQEIVKKRTLLSEGDEIEVAFTFTEETGLLPEKMDLEILYEDDFLLVINKPAGLVVHPGCSHPSHTLVNALLYYLKEWHPEDRVRPGIVHRLDKDTTGIIICAKTREAQEKMVALFAERKIEKVYLAVTLGSPSVEKMEIKTFIGRDPKQRQAMAVLENKGKEAITFVERLAHTQHLALVRLYPKTGRTHQLRVHLKHVHCPILGDTLYGKKSQNSHYQITTQLLHAYTLKFIHPFTQKELYLKAPIPKLMRNMIEKISPKLFLYI